MADEPEMPKVARRRAGADTLFSAEWFDDNDEFTGTKPDGLPPSEAADPVPGPSASAPVLVRPADAGAEAAAKSGPPMLAIVAVLAVVFLGGGCLFGAGLAGGAYALGLVPF